jgi:hypothetical protein
LTAEIRRGSEIHRLGTEFGVSPLAAAGANIEPDLSRDADIRIRLDLARAPLARS